MEWWKNRDGVAASIDVWHAMPAMWQHTFFPAMWQHTFFPAMWQHTFFRRGPPHAAIASTQCKGNGSETCEITKPIWKHDAFVRSHGLKVLICTYWRHVISKMSFFWDVSRVSPGSKQYVHYISSLSHVHVPSSVAVAAKQMTSKLAQNILVASQCRSMQRELMWREKPQILAKNLVQTKQELSNDCRCQIAWRLCSCVACISSSWWMRSQIGLGNASLNLYKGRRIIFIIFTLDRLKLLCWARLAISCSVCMFESLSAAWFEPAVSVYMVTLQTCNQAG